jgi:hypothetical protein
VLQVVFGTPSHQRVRTHYSDTVATTAPLIVALCLAGLLGLWLPRPMYTLLEHAAFTVDGSGALREVRPGPLAAPVPVLAAEVPHE